MKETKRFLVDDDIFTHTKQLYISHSLSNETQKHPTLCFLNAQIGEEGIPFIYIFCHLNCH